MEARIVAGRTGSTSRTRVLLYALALASGCCWVTGCMGGPGQGPVDGGPGPGPVDGGPRDAGPDDPDAAPGPRFVQIAKIKAPNPRGLDVFGASVALAGDVLAVGMPGEDSASRGIGGDEDDQRGQGAGAVYVFRRTDAGWEKEAYLKASNAPVADDNPASHHHAFGSRVALSGDTIAVSAPNESGGSQGIDGDQEDTGAPGSGAVYVFRRDDAGWRQEAYIKPSDAHPDQHFGAEVLALDGDTLAVVATVYPYVDIMATGDPRGEAASHEARDEVGIECARERAADSVYVFRRTGTSWREEAHIPLPAGFWYDAYFGLTGTVKLSGDTLAIGAPAGTGKVHVFGRTGTTWQQEAVIQGIDVDGGNEHFGADLALAGDLLAVGAPARGAVYMFRRSGTSWRLESEVTPVTAGSWLSFGHEVALDGNQLAVASGPWAWDLPGWPGAFFVFRNDGTGWREESVVMGTPLYQENGGFRLMAFSGDDLVIGAPDDGSDSRESAGHRQGAVHAFRRFAPDAIPPDAGPGSPDAGPGDTEPIGQITLRGTAGGVREPVTLELQHRDGSEQLVVAQDGAFAFETRLWYSEYTVRLVDADAPCVLRNHEGWIAEQDVPRVELTCASLGSLLVGSTLVALAPETDEYQIDLLLSQESATVTAIVGHPGDTLTIGGVSVPSGTPSAPLALSLGDNMVDLVVENALGWQRSYRLNIRRAAEIAQHAYVKSANPGPQGGFGTALALSGDTLAVGATGEDNGSGVVYVFRQSGDAWQQEAVLQASNADSYDRFGISLALSGDLLAVGAPEEDSAALGIGGDQGNHQIRDNGAVYVFRREGTAWQQEEYIKSSRLDYEQRFGEHVALSGDTLAVGASSPPAPPDSYQRPRIPAVHVFRRSEAGWQAEAVVDVGSDLILDGLALSADTLAFGGAGKVHVFRRSGVAWQQEAQLASTCASGDRFGASVALSGDTLAVGATEEDSAARGVNGDPSGDGARESGAVYVYRRSGASWQQEAYVKASNTGYMDRFGASVALSGDTLAVGASGEASAATGVNGHQADNSARDSGAVYVFRREGAGWQQIAYVKASNAGGRDGFGGDVVLSDGVLAAGAQFEDSTASGINGDHADNGVASSGAAYVFHHLLQ